MANGCLPAQCQEDNERRYEAIAKDEILLSEAGSAGSWLPGSICNFHTATRISRIFYIFARSNAPKNSDGHEEVPSKQPHFSPNNFLLLCFSWSRFHFNSTDWKLGLGATQRKETTINRNEDATEETKR